MWSIEKSNKIIISTIIIYFLLVSSCIVLLIVSYRMTISNYFSRFHDSIYSIWIRLNSLSIWRENVLKKTEIRRVMIRRNGWKRMECRQSSQKCSALSLISLRRAQTVQPCRNVIWNIAMKYGRNLLRSLLLRFNKTPLRQPIPFVFSYFSHTSNFV